MNTDYKNLNAFESSVVICIAVGVMLIVTLIINGISVRQQENLIAALDILDAHEQVSHSIESTNFILGMQEEFYNQFYIAFTQVAILPEEIIEAHKSDILTAYNQIAEYSDQIAFEYRLQNSPEHRIVYGTKITGGVIDLSVLLKNSVVTKYSKESLSPPRLNIPYSFAPPEWQPIKQKLTKIWTE